MEKKTFLCPFCQEELIKGAKFCKKCGTRLNVCPSCSAPLKPGTQFCPMCGLRLSPPSVPSQSSPISQDSKILSRGTVFAILGGVVVIAFAAGVFFHSSRSPKEPISPIAAPDTSSRTTTPSPAPETRVYADASTAALVTQSPDETTVPSTDADIETSADGLSSDLQDYILPESNSRLLTESDLADLTKEELRLARNEIYARYGRKFKDTALQDYFNSKSWYQGTIEPAAFDARQDNVLSKIEIANLDFIKNHENIN